MVPITQNEQKRWSSFSLHPAALPSLPLASPRQEANHKTCPCLLLAFSAPHPGLQSGDMRTQQSVFCPLCPWCHCLDSHISDITSTPRKDKWAAETNSLTLPSDTSSKWPPYSPTPSDPAYTPEPGTRILEKGAAGRLETPQRPGFVHLCKLHPKAHNSKGTKTNLHLYSSLENASLCPISLPYTWQTLSKSTWTRLEWNWIGTELSAEKVTLSLFSQGELLFIPSSVHPQLFLDAFVWPSPCKIAINLFPCLHSQYTMNSPNTESPCLFHFYISRSGT